MSKLSLNCLIYGQTVDRMVTVDVDPQSKLQALRQALLSLWSTQDDPPQFVGKIQEKDLVLLRGEKLPCGADAQEVVRKAYERGSFLSNLHLSSLFPASRGDQLDVIIKVVMKLICVVLSDDNATFTVEVPRVADIRDLKRIVAEKKIQLCYTPPPELSTVISNSTFEDIRLYQAPLDITIKPQQDLCSLCRNLSLLPDCPLYTIFPKDLKADIPTIIVESAVLNLDCVIPPLYASFVVRIPRTTRVSILKKAIKASHGQLHDVREENIMLWKVPIKPSPANVEQLQSVRVQLDDGDLLNHVIPSPSMDRIYIMVEVLNNITANDAHTALPVTLRNQRYSAQKKRKRESPSTQARAENFDSVQVKEEGYYACARPRGRQQAIPLPLIDGIFAQFVDDCKSAVPTTKEHRPVDDLTVKMCTLFTHEAERQEALRGLFEQYELELPYTHINGGHMMCNNNPVLILEVKNEIGSTSAVPTLQALVYYDQICFKRRLADDESSCHPCFMISIVGPVVHFGGLVLTDRSTLEIFSSFPLDIHDTDDDAFFTLARHFLALKNAVKKLCTIYKNRGCSEIPAKALAVRSSQTQQTKKRKLTDNHSHPVYRIFPYPTSFTPINPSGDQKVSFKYVDVIRERSLLFGGKVRNDPICIKFVRRYGKDVHLWFADRGYAPKLMACEALPGGRLMIIMELLDDSWIPLQDSHYKGRVDLKEKMRLLIMDLNNAGYVHGDLRDINIMVRKDNILDFKVVDFDWGGRGEVTYPRLLNKEVFTKEEMADGKPILVGHDLYMFDAMFGNTSNI